ncbi:reverse transcriptase/maturase family protein [Thiococcus pfennigii]|uniref:reverse transcriptase/maturase family protein n=1 Tax=Thiococcus pfennigii TaxID=1057 RepID=UPI00190597C6|nr:reverse transcriptase/maturase family protein [Thiococcus pfennigii]
MPKRHGQLYDDCFTLDALHAAYVRSRRGKRGRRAALEFERDLGNNLHRLREQLMDGAYAPARPAQFFVREPKLRLITAPTFRDTVVQHAIYARIYPIFDRSFIYDSYGCRVGKGTHRASDQAQRFLRQSSAESFTLQTDVRRFYYSIDRLILRHLIEHKLKDERLIDLMMRFAWQDDPLGVPIGSLLSQLYALIYLDPFDQWVKRERRIARYVRYVDDAVFFGLARDEAVALRERVADWLEERLHLQLSRYTIAPVSRGVNFVGFRTWRSRRFVRKHSLATFSRAMARGDCRSLVSIFGNARRTASFCHLGRRLLRERPALLGAMPFSIRRDLGRLLNA